MKQIGLCLLFVLATQGVCLADTTNAPAVDEKIAQMLGQYHEVRSVTNLPPSVFKLCADLNKRLANPGEKWEATDVITDERVPRHRMIWAVTHNRSYIVHYECGGRAHTFNTIIVETKDGGTDTGSVQSGRMNRPFKDFKAFLEYNFKTK